LPLWLSRFFFGFAVSSGHPTQEKTHMNVKRITPVLLVKEIEPLIPFWVDRLGFTKTIAVPDLSLIHI